MTDKCESDNSVRYQTEHDTSLTHYGTFLMTVHSWKEKVATERMKSLSLNLFK